MVKINQAKTPLFDAVKKYVDDEVIPFHVPGHKQGRGMQELREYLGDKIFQIDANGMDDLDYANNPTRVILEAERLYADAFRAKHAYFLLNGTTAGVQTMIMTVCEPGDKIIIPRNAHKSTVGALILSGAIPAYVQPEIDERLGIAMGVTKETIKKAIKENPYASAVYIINPTYYGHTSDLEGIVELAHKNDMAVIVDEAHGAHFGFHDDFPISAMDAGADMSAASMHKTCGSFTQSSILLHQGNFISPKKIRQIINLTATTSSSYILMTSLDVARKQLALEGEEMLGETLKRVRWARLEINKMPGLYCFGEEMIKKPGVYGFDETKLGVCVKELGITGYEVESMLRKEYNIQIEFSDLFNILAIASLGDDDKTIKAFVDAMREIAKTDHGQKFYYKQIQPCSPKMIVSPRDAFYGEMKTVPLEEAIGEIAGEMVMAYPPGIPVLCMGEKITKEIVEYIKILKSQKCHLQGTSDIKVENLMVLGR